MPAPPPTPEQPVPEARRRSRKNGSPAGEEGEAAAPAAKTATEAPPQTPQESPEDDIAAELSFREAQTALELSLAELQAPDLDVEEMAGLYRRASRYADRCEQLLQQVEQEVMQWDPGQPQEAPQPYQD